jgi:hypothetical protein
MCRLQVADAELPPKNRAEIDVLGFESGGIGVGDVSRQHFHPARFKLQGVGVYAKKRVQHVCLPRFVTIHPVNSRKRAKKITVLILLVFIFF